MISDAVVDALLLKQRVELARQGMQVWDLDDSDYGDVGSHDPTPHAYDH